LPATAIATTISQMTLPARAPGVTGGANPREEALDKVSRLPAVDLGRRLWVLALEGGRRPGLRAGADHRRRGPRQTGLTDRGLV
jgi:hypothetical protein